MIVNNQLYFIHIPRTGGRFIKSLLKKNFFTSEESSLTTFSNDYPDLLKSHLHYPLYLKENISNYFTIIRDPFEKFMSSIKLEIQRNNKLLEHLTETKLFNQFVEEHRGDKSYHNNWYRPQYEFIDSNTKTWHYSLGFNQSFFNWLKQNCDLNIKNTDANFEQLDFETKTTVYDNVDISLIKKNVYLYYKKDLILSQTNLTDLRLQGY